MRWPEVEASVVAEALRVRWTKTTGGERQRRLRFRFLVFCLYLCLYIYIFVFINYIKLFFLTIGIDTFSFSVPVSIYIYIYIYLFIYIFYFLFLVFFLIYLKKFARESFCCKSIAILRGYLVACKFARKNILLQICDGNHFLADLQGYCERFLFATSDLQRNVFPCSNFANDDLQRNCDAYFPYNTLVLVCFH